VRAGVEAIAPGVHAIRLRFLWIHALQGDGETAGGRITLIDAGLPRSRPTIERGLASIGHSIGDVGRIVCTHAHPDHAGGVRGLAGEGVDVLMHPSDIDAISAGALAALTRPSRSGLLAYATPTPGRLHPVDDGAVLPVLDGLRVVHTPGHTPGSICLYGPRDRLLFVGDALQVTRGRLDFANTVASTDIATARRSVRRLAALNVETIVFSHYKPWRDDANAALAELAARSG
jgi:glyoxylase-like metal-dependent hydrolase (beta-lactamase superfamily II)